MKIKPKLTASYLVIAIIPLLMAIGVGYYSSRQAIINIQTRSLEAIADLKIGVISRYLEGSKDEVAIAQDYFNIKSNLPILDEYYQNPEHDQYIAAKVMLDEQLSSWLVSGKNVDNIYLVNQSGKIVYFTNKDHGIVLGQPLPDPYSVSFLKGSADVYLSDLYLETHPTRKYSFIVSAPITDLTGKYAGVIAFDFDASYLYSLIQDASGLGQTGETLIGQLLSLRPDGKDIDPQLTSANDAVVFLNPLRHDSNAAFNRVVALGSTEALPLQNAISGVSGSGLADDYRGIKVLSAWRKIPQYDLGLVAKIDFGEVILPITTIGIYSTIFGVIAILIIIFLANHIAHSITAPITKLTSNAEKIASGKLDIIFDDLISQNNDEIGTLSQAFSSMTDQLRGLYRSMENKIKERTRKLQESLAKDEAILGSIGDGVLVTDSTGAVLIANSSAKNMLQLSTDDLIGKKIHTVLRMINKEGKVIKQRHRPITKVMKSGKTFTSNISDDYYYVRKDNTSFPVSLTLNPVRLEGEIIGTIEVFRDITEEREIDQAKSDFVSFSSHQLLTPLTAIKWYTRLLLSDSGKITPKQKEYLDSVYSSNERMVGLVNSLLNVSRLEMGAFTVEPVPTDIPKLVDSVIEESTSSISQKKLTLNVNISPNIPKIRIDPKLFRIVIQNLISNAIKYNKQGGAIRIDLTQDLKRIYLSVSDTGLGIPAHQQKHIFSKLFRADNAQKSKTEGTGLGLYIVKTILDQTQSKIWFESEESKGTTFFVSIPLKGFRKKIGTKKLIE